MSCHRSDRAPQFRQRGAALVVAMFVVAICTVVIVAIRGEFDRFYQRTANQLLMTQGEALLRSGEAAAIVVLKQDYDEDQESGQTRDDPSETWANIDQQPQIIEGAMIRGKLIDLQGLFNLNTLAAPAPKPDSGKKFTPYQAQFIRLLQVLEEPEISEFEARVITQAVSDWMDADGNPYPEGAEDQYYYSREPSYRAPNRPMASVSELLAVANMTPEIFYALAPFVTVWPSQPAPLNIHTAPLEVLRSLNEDEVLVPLDPSEAESLVTDRGEGGFENLQVFREHAVMKSRIGKMSTALGESSQWFLLRTDLEVADRYMRLYSVVWRADRDVAVMTRASGSSPIASVNGIL